MKRGGADDLGWIVGRLRNVADAVSTLLWAYAIALGVVLTGLVFAQVVVRYLFGGGLPWVNELSQYIAIWMFLPLAAVLILNDEHIKINVFVDRLSVQTARRLELLELVVLLGFGVGFTYAGAQYAFESGFRSVSPSLGIDMFWFYLVLPLSGVLFCFFGAVRLLELLVDEDTDVESSETQTREVDIDLNT